MIPKVSIIVPIYGVENYIERCVRSLFEQTFDDVEYIFVEDSTKDRSLLVLQKVMADYPEKGEKIRIIHHEQNKGLPQARRTGMLAAKGDYIINFDSDDWVDKTIIERLYGKAVEEQADIVICDYCKTDGVNETIYKACNSIEKEKYLRDLCSMRITWSTWNKMFKRSLLDENTQFPSCNMAEDMGLMLPLVLKAKRLAYVPTPLYYYCYNALSITHAVGEKATVKKAEMFHSNAEIVFAAFDNVGLSDQYRESIDAIKLNAKNKYYGLTYSKKYYKIWKETYKEINHRILYNTQISIKDKLLYVLTYLHIYPPRKCRVSLDK